MTTIHLHNTKTRRKEPLVPIKPGEVSMYVCGPTVYDRAHIGNARPVIVFDTLFRLLRHVYGTDHVTYVRNFTDVDDKINARAAESGRSIREITDETTQWYLDDMAAVGALAPTHMPRATEYIAQMIAMIKTLIQKGYAYSAPISFGHNSRAVYFNSEKAPEHSFFEVAKYQSYGELSGRSVEDMIAGAKSELGEGKRNPMDFVLWKPSTSDQPAWESPWGLGRPGWHIECSAMAKALLGDEFDIHGGGLDLQFPHHENEIAQSCCANDTDQMASIWMHNEMLQVEGKKMSKSLGNFFTVRDLLDQGVPGEVIRFVFLSTHYRKPMDWTARKAEHAKSELHKWRENLTGVAPSEPCEDFVNALKSDLNTPKAISQLQVLFLRWMQARSVGVNFGKSEEESEAVFLASAQLLGLLHPELGEWFNAEFDFWQYVDKFNALRDEAMGTKDFGKLDEMKAALTNAGAVVKMSKSGVEISKGPAFDPAKLAGLL